MMMKEMMKQCCGEGGMPEPEKMKEFMENCGAGWHPKLELKEA